MEIKERRRPEEEVQEEETGSGFKYGQRLVRRTRAELSIKTRFLTPLCQIPPNLKDSRNCRTGI